MKESLPIIKCKAVSGYIKNNPNNYILNLENTILKILGLNSKEYSCVITNSMTNALKTVLEHNRIFQRVEVDPLPKRTYQGVYNAINAHKKLMSLYLNTPYKKQVLKNIKWKEYYQVDNWVDCATTLLDKTSGTSAQELLTKAEFLLFSFGNQKPIKMNTGGAIVFKNTFAHFGTYSTKPDIFSFYSFRKYSFLKRAIHDGRDSAKKITSDTLLTITDNGSSGVYGAKYNIVPEQAKIALSYIKGRYLFGYPRKTWKDYPQLQM